MPRKGVKGRTSTTAKIFAVLAVLLMVFSAFAIISDRASDSSAETREQTSLEATVVYHAGSLNVDTDYNEDSSGASRSFTYYGTVVSTEYNPQVWEFSDDRWFEINSYSEGHTYVFTGWKFATGGSLQGDVFTPNDFYTTTYDPGDVILCKKFSLPTEAQLTAKKDIYYSTDRLSFTEASDTQIAARSNLYHLTDGGMTDHWYVNHKQGGKQVYDQVDIDDKGRIHIYATWDTLENCYTNPDKELNWSDCNSKYRNIVLVSGNNRLDTICNYINAPFTIRAADIDNVASSKLTDHACYALKQELIIDNISMEYKSGKAGNTTDTEKMNIDANNKVLIIGTGINSIKTSGVNKSGVYYGQYAGIQGGYNGDTKMIIHSGIYSDIFGCGKPGYTSVTIMNGGVVLETLSGGSQSKNSKTTGDIYLYMTGVTTYSDSYTDYLMNHENEGTKIPGANTIAKSALIGESSMVVGGNAVSAATSTHVYLTGTSDVWTIQAAGREKGSSISGDANMEISGKAIVRNVACGCITDAKTTDDKYSCITGNVNINVRDDVYIATLVGGGYDTFGKTVGACFQGGGHSININVDGGNIGYIYGGGLRGPIGTSSNPTNINININGGNIVRDVYGGGSGTLVKIKHTETTGAIQGNDASMDPTGLAYVYGNITINMTGGVVNGSLYGGGKSVARVYSYGGEEFKIKPSDTRTTMRDNVAMVDGSITINISDGEVKGNVFGAGKGIDLSKLIEQDAVNSEFSSLYVIRNKTSGSTPVMVNPNQLVKSDVSISSDLEFAYIPWAKQNLSNSEKVKVTFTPDDTKYREYAKVVGNTWVNISGDCIIYGSVYGGGQAGKLYGDANVHIIGGTVIGTVYGGGLGVVNIVSVTGKRRVTVGAYAVIKGSVYGGSSLGTDCYTTVTHIPSGVTVEVGDTLTIGSGEKTQYFIVDEVDIGGTPEGINYETSNGVRFTAGGSDAVIYLKSGTVSGSVFGGGFQGKTYGDTHIFVGKDSLSLADNDVLSDGPFTVKSVKSMVETADHVKFIVTDGVNNEATVVYIPDGVSVALNGTVSSGGVDYKVTSINTDVRVTLDGKKFIITDLKEAHATVIEGSVALDSLVEDTGTIAIGGSIYLGGDVGVIENSSEAYIDNMVMGSGELYVAKDPDADNISFSGSIMGSGNSCLTKGETTVYLKDLISFATASGESIHRATNVTIDGCVLELNGRATIENTLSNVNNTDYSLYRIEHLNLKNGSIFVLNGAINYVYELNSLNSNGDQTTSTSPLNKIVVGGGNLFMLKEIEWGDNSSYTESYGKVKGYTIIAGRSDEYNYGVLAFGSPVSDGGFVVLSNGTFVNADYSDLSDDCRCWYLAGAINNEVTSTVVGGNSVELSVNMPSLQSGSSYRYTGGTFVPDTPNVDSYIDTESAVAPLNGKFQVRFGNADTEVYTEATQSQKEAGKHLYYATPMSITKVQAEGYNDVYYSTDGKTFSRATSEQRVTGEHLYYAEFTAATQAQIDVGVDLYYSDRDSERLVFADDPWYPQNGALMKNDLGKGDPILGLLQGGASVRNPHMMIEIQSNVNEFRYLGYVLICINEVVEVNYNNTTSYIVVNTIQTKIHIYAEVSTLGDTSIDVGIIDGTGSSTFIIPSGWAGQKLVVESITPKDGASGVTAFSLTAVKNKNNTPGWTDSLGTFVLRTDGSASGVTIGTLQGGYNASLLVQIGSFTGTGEESYELKLMIKDDTHVKRFTLTVNVSKVDDVSVTFYVDDDTQLKYTYNYGTVITLPDCPPTGDHFVGWYTDYTFNNEFTFTIPITKNMTLYARYMYEVTLDYMDGTSSVVYIPMPKGVIGSMPDPVRPGYDFGGWYEDTEYEHLWDLATGEISSSKTLYARWVGWNIKVDFKVDFGSGLEPIDLDADKAKHHNGKLLDCQIIGFGTQFNTRDNFDINNVETPMYLLEWAQYNLKEDTRFEGYKFIYWTYPVSGSEKVVPVYTDSYLNDVGRLEMDGTDYHIENGYRVVVLIAKLSKIAVAINMDSTVIEQGQSVDNLALVDPPSSFLVFPEDDEVAPYIMKIRLNGATRPGYSLDGWSLKSPTSGDDWVFVGEGGTYVYAAGSEITLKIVSNGEQWKGYFIVNSEDERYAKDVIKISTAGAARLEGNGQNLTFNFQSHWEWIPYSVSIADPAHGSIVATYLNSDGIYERFTDTTFHYGDTVNLVFTPDQGYRFHHWYSSGDGVFNNVGEASTTFVIRGDTNISAYLTGPQIVRVFVEYDGLFDGKVTAGNTEYDVDNVNTNIIERSDGVKFIENRVADDIHYVTVIYIPQKDPAINVSVNDTFTMEKFQHGGVTEIQYRVEYVNTNVLETADGFKFIVVNDKATVIEFGDVGSIIPNLYWKNGDVKVYFTESIYILYTDYTNYHTVIQYTGTATLGQHDIYLEGRSFNGEYDLGMPIISTTSQNVYYIMTSKQLYTMVDVPSGSEILEDDNHTVKFAITDPSDGGVTITKVLVDGMEKDINSTITYGGKTYNVVAIGPNAISSCSTLKMLTLDADKNPSDTIYRYGFIRIYTNGILDHSEDEGSSGIAGIGTGIAALDEYLLRYYPHDTASDSVTLTLEPGYYIYSDSSGTYVDESSDSSKDVTVTSYLDDKTVTGIITRVHYTVNIDYGTDAPPGVIPSESSVTVQDVHYGDSYSEILAKYTDVPDGVIVISNGCTGGEELTVGGIKYTVRAVNTNIITVSGGDYNGVQFIVLTNGGTEVAVFYVPEGVTVKLNDTINVSGTDYIVKKITSVLTVSGGQYDGVEFITSYSVYAWYILPGSSTIVNSDMTVSGDPDNSIYIYGMYIESVATATIWLRTEQVGGGYSVSNPLTVESDGTVHYCVDQIPGYVAKYDIDAATVTASDLERRDYNSSIPVSDNPIAIAPGSENVVIITYYRAVVDVVITDANHNAVTQQYKKGDSVILVHTADTDDVHYSGWERNGAEITIPAEGYLISIQDVVGVGDRLTYGVNTYIVKSVNTNIITVSGGQYNGVKFIVTDENHNVTVFYVPEGVTIVEGDEIEIGDITYTVSVLNGIGAVEAEENHIKFIYDDNKNATVIYAGKITLAETSVVREYSVVIVTSQAEIHEGIENLGKTVSLSIPYGTTITRLGTYNEVLDLTTGGVTTRYALSEYSWYTKYYDMEKGGWTGIPLSETVTGDLVITYHWEPKTYILRIVHDDTVSVSGSNISSPMLFGDVEYLATSINTNVITVADGEYKGVRYIITDPINNYITVIDTNGKTIPATIGSYTVTSVNTDVKVTASDIEFIVTDWTHGYATVIELNGAVITITYSSVDYWVTSVNDTVYEVESGDYNGVKFIITDPINNYITVIYDNGKTIGGTIEYNSVTYVVKSVNTNIITVSGGDYDGVKFIVTDQDNHYITVIDRNNHDEIESALLIQRGPDHTVTVTPDGLGYGTIVRLTLVFTGSNTIDDSKSTYINPIDGEKYSLQPVKQSSLQEYTIQFFVTDDMEIRIVSKWVGEHITFYVQSKDGGNPVINPSMTLNVGKDEPSYIKISDYEYVPFLEIEGYYFDGWYTDASFINQPEVSYVGSNYCFKITGNTSLFARYVKLVSGDYDLTYDGTKQYVDVIPGINAPLKVTNVSYDWEGGSGDSVSITNVADPMNHKPISYEFTPEKIYVYNDGSADTYVVSGVNHAYSGSFILNMSPRSVIVIANSHVWYGGDGHSDDGYSTFGVIRGDTVGSVTVSAGSFEELGGGVRRAYNVAEIDPDYVNSNYTVTCYNGTLIIVNTSLPMITAVTTPDEITLTSSDPITVTQRNSTITITQGSFTKSVTGSNVRVVIDNVTISSSDEPAISIGEECNVTLVVRGTCSLTGGAGKDGISVSPDASLTITGTGTFTVRGNNGSNSDSEGGSGIGYVRGTPGKITVSDLSGLYAYGYGDRGYGIGGQGAKVIIENSTVVAAQGGTVTGDGEGGPGIGGRHITIRDSVISEARGGSKSPGIGDTYPATTKVLISGSTVTAYGGSYSDGIGGGSFAPGYPAQTVIIHTNDEEYQVTSINTDVKTVADGEYEGVRYIITDPINNYITVIDTNGKTIGTTIGSYTVTSVNTDIRTAGGDYNGVQFIVTDQSKNYVTVIDCNGKAVAVTELSYNDNEYLVVSVNDTIYEVESGDYDGAEFIITSGTNIAAIGPNGTGIKKDDEVVYNGVTYTVESVPTMYETSSGIKFFVTDGCATVTDCNGQTGLITYLTSDDSTIVSHHGS